METNSGTPTISVIINCYNGETFLRETLQSLFSQTFRDFEVIFWDNRSTDSSARILQSFEDPRVRYFLANEFTTLGEARNLAFAKAKGQWTAFLDCDDLWHADKLEQQIASIFKSPTPDRVGLVYTRTVCLGGPRDGLEIFPTWTGRPLPSGNLISTYLANENFIALSSALILSEAFRTIGAIPAHFKQAEDFYIFANIAARWLVEVVQEPMTIYRVHGNNWTSRQQYEGFTEQLSTIRTCLDLLPSLASNKAIHEKLGNLSLYAAWYAIKKKHSAQLALSHVFQPSFLSFCKAVACEIRRRTVGESS